MLDGEVEGEIDGARQTLQKDAVVVIPPGVTHRFCNRGEKSPITFNVYSPLEYPVAANVGDGA
ncbi:MAG: cupin domain-containing protein [Spartobacteria bacterium]